MMFSPDCAAWRRAARASATFCGSRASRQAARRAHWSASACGSACWFTGFAYAPVALVRAVGQVEILFTLLFSRFFLRERMKRSDVIGALVVVSGVVLVLLGR